jgi:hypothetical protein
VIVQCNKCFAKANGSLSRRQLVSADIPFLYVGPGDLTHRGCGGALEPYDIKERSDWELGGRS